MLTKTIHALLVAGIISLPALAGEKQPTIKEEPKEEIQKAVPVVKKEQEKPKEISPSSPSTFSFQIGAVQSDPKISGTIPTTSLKKEGYSLSFSYTNKEYRFLELDPTVELEYMGFTDREVLIVSLGMKQVHTIDNYWKVYITPSLGHGLYNWKSDPIDNVGSRDKSVLSTVVSLKVGGLYKLSEKNSLDLALKYSMSNFETEIKKSGTTSMIEDNGFFSFGVGVGF